MSDLTAAVERHCELFNESVLTGDWAPFVSTFAEHATLSFVDGPVGPFTGRDQIALAYAEQPPNDTITLEAVEELDPNTARVQFAWDAGGYGEMLLRWHDDELVLLEVKPN
jgi:hypothetical protein